MIYFIHAEGVDLIKIGYAADIRPRMRTLATISPVKLHLMGTIEGSLADEKTLHFRFAHLRSHGEWFHSDPSILDYIHENATDLISGHSKHPGKVACSFRLSDEAKEILAWAKETLGLDRSAALELAIRKLTR